MCVCISVIKAAEGILLFINLINSPGISNQRVIKNEEIATIYSLHSQGGHFPLILRSGGEAQLYHAVLQQIVIISLLPDCSATEKTMDSKNLEGHQAIVQGKTTHLMIR